MSDRKECCPVPDKNKWHKKTHEWKDKKFIVSRIPLFFHMPNPKKITEAINSIYEAAKTAGANTKDEDFLMLAHDSSAWKGEYMLNVTKEVPGQENMTMSGTFVSMLFDGPYNAVPKFIKELDAYAREIGKEVDDYYFHYATCPKCMKETGHNYIIGFAKLK